MPDFPSLPKKVDFPPNRLVDFPRLRRVDFPPYTMAWLSGWSYRKSHEIIGSEGAGSNYAVRIKVHRRSGTDSGADVYLNWKCRRDFGDIRFTSDDGQTLLSYFMEDYNNVKRMASDGVWCWFQDPRAIYYEGTYKKTYIGYVNHVGDVRITSINHETGAVHSYTLHAELNIDDHAAPAILIRNDGRLIVFYCTHSLTNDLYYRISTNPEDVTSWETEQIAYSGAAISYPQPFQIAEENNRIYVFFREHVSETDNRGDWCYVYSDDGGSTWSSVTHMVRVVEGHRCVYAKAVQEGSKIHFAFTDCYTDNPDQKGYVKHIRYCYYENGSFYKADGTLIKTVNELPIMFDELDLVYDSDAEGNDDAWVWDIAIDSEGHPVIVFAKIISVDDHRYMYARWTGSSWVYYEITSAGPALYAQQLSYSPGVYLDHQDPSIVYLSKMVGSHREIQKWKTTDGGSTWSYEKITKRSPQDNLRPVSVWNHKNLIPVVWFYGTYNTYMDYDTDIWGDDIESAIFWVKITSNLDNNQTIYIYYGNPDATSISDGESVFEFFDDFPGDSLNFDKWEVDEGSNYSVVEGLLRLVYQTTRVKSKASFTPSHALRLRVKVIGDLDVRSSVWTADYGTRLDQCWYDGARDPETLYGSYRTSGGSAIDIGNTPAIINQFYVLESRWLTNKVEVLKNDVSYGSATPDWSSIANMHIYLHAGQDDSEAYWDWVLIRKYVDPEPSHGSWGSEESY